MQTHHKLISINNKTANPIRVMANYGFSMHRIGALPKTTKIVLFTVGGFMGLLVLIAAALFLFVDADAYRYRLEKTASEVLGMEVRVDGQLGVSILPGLIVALEDVHISNQGADIATVKEARLEIDFFPLLKKEVRIEKIALKNPRISIERDRDGNFNFEKPVELGGTLPILDLAKISLSGGTLLYVDKQSG